MYLTIVALYTICDDFLIALGHRSHQPAKMPAAKVMTTILVAAKYFAGNQQIETCCVLKTLRVLNNSLAKGGNLG